MAAHNLPTSATSPAFVATYTTIQRQALARLSHIRTLNWWRLRHGERPETDELVALADLIVDALRHLHGDGRHTLDRSGVLMWMPSLWHAHLPKGTIGGVLEEPRPPRGIATNAEVGRRLAVRLHEVLEIADAGHLLPFHAVDETAEARAERRASRRREMDAARKRTRRAAVRESNSDVRSPYRQADTGVTFAAARVLEALDNGATSPTEVGLRVGCTRAAAQMTLGRLLRAGRIEKRGHGRYVTISTSPTSPTSTPALAAEVLADLDARAINSGPATPRKPQEPPAEIVHDAPAPVPAEASDRGPDVEPLRPASAGAPAPSSNANDDAAETEGALPPHRRARLSKVMPTDAHALAFPSSAALRQFHEAARFAAPILPSTVALSARLRAIRALVASSTAA